MKKTIEFQNHQIIHTKKRKKKKIDSIHIYIYIYIYIYIMQPKFHREVHLLSQLLYCSVFQVKLDVRVVCNFL